MITVVGLGPGNINLLTLEAYQILKHNHVYLRTAIHPIVDDFKKEGIEFSSFDDLYNEAKDFESVYDTIVKTLEKLEKEHGDIVYAVPGNPILYESSVKKLINTVGSKRVKIIPGISFIDVIADVIGSAFDENFCVEDAYSFTEDNYFYPLDRAVIVSQVHNQFLLSAVKLKLLNVLPDDFKVAVITHAGTNRQTIEWIKLFELDHRQGDHLMSLYIPKYDNPKASFNDLIYTIKRLRDPDGCPWDRKQTHSTLKRYVLEEAAEVVDAIEKNDLENLKEELGDLLLQVILHSQIATEAEEFDVYDVIDEINQKMIRRHPHVFGSESVDTDDKVLDLWENLKFKEKHLDLISEDMKNLPLSMSALLKSDKIQDKARSVGFDWNDPLDALEKVSEERNEVIDAIKNGTREHLIEGMTR